ARRLVCRRDFVQSQCKPFQAFVQLTGRAAEADPEMFGHLEEVTRDHAGLVLIAQQLSELVDGSGEQLGERGGADGLRHVENISTGGYKIVPDFSVGSQ